MGNSCEIITQPLSQTVSKEIVNFEDEDKFLVAISQDDPENLEHRLSTVRKYYITLLVSCIAIIITALSSIWTFEGPFYQKSFISATKLRFWGLHCSYLV